MKRRLLTQGLLALLASVSLSFTLPAFAADEAPDALIDRLTKDALDTIQADKSIQAGDVARIMELMDQKIMPYVDFQRMTQLAAGRNWRVAPIARIRPGRLFGSAACSTRRRRCGPAPVHCR